MSFSPFAECPLCHSQGSFLQPEFYTCPECDGIFRSPNHLPTLEAEKSRYETHNNDVHDTRYQEFVRPIVNAILSNFWPKNHGLDFGAGSGPVISHLLEQQGYLIKQYDPFFHPYPELLKQTYDYIACCEVIEHFHRPAFEFEQLKKLLRPGGSLFCMTHLYAPEIDFANWYYKNDFTHVFFYQQATMRWIQRHYGFSAIKIEERLITLLA